MSDIEFRGYGLGCPATIAREHHDRQPGVSQLLERFRSGFLDRVGHPDQPDQSSVAGDEHDGLAFAVELVGAGEHRAGIDAKLAHEGDVAKEHRTGHRPEIIGGDGLDAPCLGALHDGRRQRVLAADLDARGEAQHFAVGNIRDGYDRTQARPSLGEGSRLVHDQGVYLLEDLERLRVPYQHAGERATAGADHDRHRRRQPERTRAGDDEDGHRVDEAVRQSRLGAPCDPHSEGRYGDQHDGGDEPGRDEIRQALDRRAAPLRLAHHMDNLSQQRLAAHAHGPHDETARGVHGAADHPAPRGLLHGYRLAGHH